MTTAQPTQKGKKLQKGAVLLIPPIRKTTGNWVEMDYDAKGEYFGMPWLRVKDGMGGNGDREDWVADIPSVSISVHDYHWNGNHFGMNHGSFIGAIKAETQRSLDYAIQTEVELQQKLVKVCRGIELIRAAIDKF